MNTRRRRRRRIEEEEEEEEEHITADKTYGINLTFVLTTHKVAIGLHNKDQ